MLSITSNSQCNVQHQLPRLLYCSIRGSPPVQSLNHKKLTAQGPTVRRTSVAVCMHVDNCLAETLWDGNKCQRLGGVQKGQIPGWRERDRISPSMCATFSVRPWTLANSWHTSSKTSLHTHRHINQCAMLGVTFVFKTTFECVIQTQSKAIINNNGFLAIYVFPETISRLCDGKIFFFL